MGIEKLAGCGNRNLRIAARVLREADERFRQVLTDAYGPDRAGDMWYARQHPRHPEVERARESQETASDQWQRAAIARHFTGHLRVGR